LLAHGFWTPVMLHGQGPAQLPGWDAKKLGTSAQFIVSVSNLWLLILWQTWHWAGVGVGVGLGVGVGVGRGVAVGVGRGVAVGVGLWWGLSAKTGSVIAKKPKVIAMQTNIAVSVFLNSVE